MPKPQRKFICSPRFWRRVNSSWPHRHSQFNAEIGAIRRQNHRTGIYDIHTNMMQVPASMQPTHARIKQVEDSTVGVPGSKIFTPLDPSIPRNIKVLDVTTETPPCGIAPGSFPGKDVPDFLRDFQGLGAMSDEIKDLLPPECRVAFDAALEKENKYKASLGNEKEATHRREPIIDISIVPYPKQQAHHPQHPGQWVAHSTTTQVHLQMYATSSPGCQTFGPGSHGWSSHVNRNELRSIVLRELMYL
jgi:hypothetical protein